MSITKVWWLLTFGGDNVSLTDILGLLRFDLGGFAGSSSGGLVFSHLNLEIFNIYNTVLLPRISINENPRIQKQVNLFVQIFLSG